MTKQGYNFSREGRDANSVVAVGGVVFQIVERVVMIIVY